MILTIQQGDYTVNLSKICSIEWDEDYQSADVYFENDFLGAYTFEEEDYEALQAYLASAENDD
jgi:hypothetical protein